MLVEGMQLLKAKLLKSQNIYQSYVEILRAASVDDPIKFCELLFDTRPEKSATCIQELYFSDPNDLGVFLRVDVKEEPLELVEEEEKTLFCSAEYCEDSNYTCANVKLESTIEAQQKGAENISEHEEGIELKEISFNVSSDVKLSSLAASTGEGVKADQSPNSSRHVPDNNLVQSASSKCRNTKLHYCKQCNKAFPYLHTLRRHERLHVPKTAFTCNVCSKAFVKHCDLKRHRLTHTGEKPHKCNNCDKTFARSSNLKIHERLHTGVKPFKCNQCTKAFSHSGNLLVHKRSHTGEKPHPCSHCNKAFTRSGDLRKHELRHAGKKSIRCKYCFKAFTQSCRYMSACIRERPCKYCFKAFSRTNSL